MRRHYPQNANIYWMGILKEYQSRGYGRLLIESAIQHARAHNAKTMTVETLAPDESDENYLKTYRFYERMGFAPLFNLKPNGYEWNMVYMCLVLGCNGPLSRKPRKYFPSNRTSNPR